MLDVILKVLCPFHIATKQLSSNSEPTIHLIWRTYNDFFNALNSIEGSLNLYKVDLKPAIKAAFDKISEYYLWTYNKDGLFYNIGVVLNPMKRLTIYNVYTLK